MIDFALTAEQKEMLATVDRYCAKRLPTAEIRRRDQEHLPPYDLLPDLAELGILGLPSTAVSINPGSAWRWCRRGSPGTPISRRRSFRAWSRSAACR